MTREVPSCEHQRHGGKQDGLDLLLDDDTYRTMTFDDYPVYYEMGEKTLPLVQRIGVEGLCSADPQAEAVETTMLLVGSCHQCGPDN